jgi:hypothetical protein
MNRFPLPLFRLFAGLLLGASLGGVCARAQLQPSYVIKFDPGAAFMSEYRVAYEWKFTRHKYLYTSAGYFSHEATIDDPLAHEQRTSGFSELWKKFIKSDYNKFLFTSASYFYRDDNVVRERLQGPVFRVGIRQYFLTKYAPRGPFLYLGVNYAFIYAEAYDEYNRVLEDLWVHKPGLSASFGYQHLFGNKRNWAVDGFGGLEYNFIIEQGKRPQVRDWRNLPNLVLYGGVSVGFAFRQRHRRLTRD